MDQDLAFELLAMNCKKVFMSYIKLAKGKSTRLEQAKELKKMVYFSNLVVSPLITGIKPPTKEELEMEKAQAEIKKIMEEAKAVSYLGRRIKLSPCRASCFTPSLHSS